MYSMTGSDTKRLYDSPNYRPDIRQLRLASHKTKS